MPAFPVPDAELDAIVSYVSALKAPAADNPSAGDAMAGERFFTGKGNCSSCHMVRGRGGILGPDLSNLGRERKTPQIERAIREPGVRRKSTGEDDAQSFKAVSLRMRDGRTLRGLAKYESPFDLGVQSLDGRFHSISRAQVADITWEPSLMPKVQASAEELRDLLAYLTRLAADRSPRATLPGTAAVTVNDGTHFADIARPKSGEWPTYHGQLSGNRHSPLDQINATNVARLAPKWTFQVPGASGALQGTPVVVDGLMYVTAANAVWALDARTGRQVWHYSRPRTPGLVGDPASGINRGVAVLGDRVFLQTDHAHLIALHRITGQLLWDAEMADYRQHYGATSAPLVVNDLVIAGVSGGDEGNRGFLDAYRASTGERVWRFWTVPARGEPGSETWIGKALEHGCAATWLTGTYDPEARLLYWPTGNPCPDYNGDERKGDNLYSNSVLALDPDTRKAQMAFPVHAARPSRLGRDRNADARRRGVSRPAAQAAAPRRSQWLFLRARPVDRRVPAGRAVRQELDLGERDRQGRPSRCCCQGTSPPRGHADLSVGGRRHELAVDGVQPDHRPVLSDGRGIVLHLYEELASGGCRASRSTVAAPADRRATSARSSSARWTCRPAKSRGRFPTLAAASWPAG